MKRILLAATAALALLPLLGGCSDRSRTDITRKSFDRIAEDAVSVYLTMHPLRSSRLGLEGADSLLFTFSDVEIGEALSAIDTLLAALASLPADDLDEDRLGRFVLLSDWMKGERYAFKQSRTCLDNPLLFCWMIEEAVMSIPTRPWPPAPGEKRAWAARLGRLPALVDNAPRFLEKPGGMRLAEAARRLEELTRTIPRLELAAERRYGAPVAELEAAREAMETYGKIIDDLMRTGTCSRLIMGAEELSKILLYSEHIDLDPAKFIKEAEKMTRRLSRQVAPTDTAVLIPEGGNVVLSAHLADSVLTLIEDGLSSRRAFGTRKRARSPVSAYDESWRPLMLPVNPYLALPVMPEREIRWDFGPAGGRGCVPSVYVPSGAESTMDRLVYDLLLSSSLISFPARKACRAASPVRMIFGVQTSRYAWEAVNIGDLTGLFPARRMQLSRIRAAERLAALSRMILVFRLHSGKFTTETAGEYLGETTPLGDAAIASEVTRAAVSPAAAFEGLAAMTVEAMTRKATGDRAGSKPAVKVRKTLLDSVGIPPFLLMTRM